MNDDASGASPHEAGDDLPTGDPSGHEPTDGGAAFAPLGATDHRAGEREPAVDAPFAADRATTAGTSAGSGSEGPWASEEDEEWRPPPSLVERASDLLTRGTRVAVVLAALAVTLTALLWAIPTAVVLRSDALATFRERVVRHRSLQAYPGHPLEVDRLPAAWTLDERGGRFSLRVRGPLGEALVRGRVRDGEVVEVERQLAVSWRDEWWRRPD